MVRSSMITVLTAAAMAAGCSEFPTSQRDAAREVRVIAGDSQSVRVNSITPRPIEIRVLDARGRPVRYTPLFWSVQMADSTPGGTITAAIAETDLDGEAEAIVEVGTTPGEYEVTILAGRYERAPGDTVEVKGRAVIFATPAPAVRQ